MVGPHSQGVLSGTELIEKWRTAFEDEYTLRVALLAALAELEQEMSAFAKEKIEKSRTEADVAMGEVTHRWVDRVFALRRAHGGTA